MKRKLKFRAWDETHKIMHHNFQFIKSGDKGNDWIVFTSDKQKLTDKPHPLENPYFSQQLKIMQFTGLHDKNGKEIYEGDIVKCDELIMTVEFVQSSFCKCNENGNWIIHSHDNIEVIGNLYENHELINIKS